MGHSLGDGIIVIALVAGFLGYQYLKHKERQRRLEVIHQERLTAMDKGVPLPELPIDPLPAPSPMEQTFPALPGLILGAFGVGAMLALAMLPADENAHNFWPMPLPVALIGFGFLLYSYLTRDRKR